MNSYQEIIQPQYEALISFEVSMQLALIKNLLENTIISTLDKEDETILIQPEKQNNLKNIVMQSTAYNKFNLNSFKDMMKNDEGVEFDPNLIKTIIEERFDPILIEVLEKKRIKSFAKNLIPDNYITEEYIKEKMENFFKISFSHYILKGILKSSKDIEEVKKIQVDIIRKFNFPPALVKTVIEENFELILTSVVELKKIPQKEKYIIIKNDIVKERIKEILKSEKSYQNIKQILEEPELLNTAKQKLKQTLIDEKYRPSLVEEIVEDRFKPFLRKMLEASKKIESKVNLSLIKKRMKEILVLDTTDEMFTKIAQKPELVQTTKENLKQTLENEKFNLDLILVALEKFPNFVIEISEAKRFKIKIKEEREKILENEKLLKKLLFIEKEIKIVPQIQVDARERSSIDSVDILD